MECSHVNLKSRGKGREVEAIILLYCIPVATSLWTRDKSERGLTRFCLPATPIRAVSAAPTRREVLKDKTRASESVRFEKTISNLTLAFYLCGAFSNLTLAFNL